MNLTIPKKNNFSMKKITLTLTVLALLTVSCNRATKQSEQQITTDTLEINKTCFIKLMYKDAETDKLFSDDLGAFLYKTGELFSEKGIEEVVAETKYLSLEVENGKKAVIDVKEYIVKKGYNALLYKKGHFPISVNIERSDKKSVENYLKILKIETLTGKKIKYRSSLYSNELEDYVNMEFFDDGTIRETKQSAGTSTALQLTYKEFPNYLLFSNGIKRQLFDRFGTILSGWDIINYYKIFSPLQITNLEQATDKIPAKNIQEIKETCLIFIAPESDYEEWVWYMDDRKTQYAKKGIPSVDAQKRYLSFTLYDNEKIIIDTKKQQNSTEYTALLYRNSYIPIMISILGSDEDETEYIEEYFRESGDGYPPFEHWNTLINN